jgi:hypothetical protein
MIDVIADIKTQNTFFYKKFNNFANRKSHNVGVRTVDTFNKEGA